MEQEVTIYKKINRALNPARAEFFKLIQEHFAYKTAPRKAGG